MLLDVGVRVPDGSAVMGDNVGDLVLAHSLSLDRAELEAGLLGVDLVSLIATLGIEEDSEVLSSLSNANDVHDAEREAGVSSDFVVNLDQTFLIPNDLNGLLASESVVESVSEENSQRDAFSSFVGPGRNAGRVDAAELVEHPVGGSCHSLLVLLGTSRLSRLSRHLKLTIFSAKIYINNK